MAMGEERDATRLLKWLQKLYAVRSQDEFPRAVLRLLPSLIEAETFAYNEVNLRAGRIVALATPGTPSAEELATRLKPHLAEHPLVSHLARQSDAPPAAISDFFAPRDWHRTALYNEFFRPLALEDQMAVGLRHDAQWVCALVFNRGRRSFSQRERRILEAARPHLRQAHDNAVAFSRLQREIELRGALNENLSGAVLVARSSGSIAFCTRQAQRFLRDYFDASTRALPELLRHWIVQDESATLLSAATPVLRVRRGAQTLVVRRGSRDQSGTLLLLQEENAEARLEELAALGLTRRQRDVLLLLARGVSTESIAAQLSLSPHTIKRHLEAIYKKLGVENRGAAARLVWQVLGGDFDF